MRPVVRQLSADVLQLCPPSADACFALNMRTRRILPMGDAVSPYMIEDYVAPAAAWAAPPAAAHHWAAPPAAAAMAPAMAVAAAAEAGWVKLGYVTREGGDGGGGRDDSPSNMNLWARRANFRRERYEYRVHDGPNNVYVLLPPQPNNPLFTGDKVHVPGYRTSYVVTLYDAFPNVYPLG
jgi:hypothetical protein